MRKKLLTGLVILLVIVALSLGLSMPAAATESRYEVGYARVDINPYVVDGDPSSGIMKLPLCGIGDVWNRLSTKGLVDDNGDGVVDENDGLKVTCIAITDSNDKTVLLFTIFKTPPEMHFPHLAVFLRTAIYFTAPFSLKMLNCTASGQISLRAQQSKFWFTSKPTKMIL